MTSINKILTQEPTKLNPVDRNLPEEEEAMVEEGSGEDSLLSNSEFLTREEVLKRRSRRLKQLAKIYKDHYWSLMEELKHKYRDYYWEYGKSPFQDSQVMEIGENNGQGDFGSGRGNDVTKCGVNGCKSKAMALTKFCHTHILSDSKQKLYVGCSYVIKSSQAGPILCGKPIMRSIVPSLCHPHFQRADKHMARALKIAGLNVTSTSKVAPKLHVLVAEYVRQIQNKRRDARKAIKEKLEIEEEEISI